MSLSRHSSSGGDSEEEDGSPSDVRLRHVIITSPMNESPPLMSRSSAPGQSPTAAAGGSPSRPGTTGAHSDSADTLSPATPRELASLARSKRVATHAYQAVCDGGTVNPLQYDWTQHAGFLQGMKMVVVGLFLLIPRAIILGVGVLVMFLGATVRTWSLPAKVVNSDGVEELPPLGDTISLRVLQFGARLVLFAAGYWWITVDDRRNISERAAASDSVNRPPVIIGNHYGFLDGFIFAYFERPMPASKYELLDVPIVGTLLRAGQAIGVVRESAEGRRAAAAEINRRARWRVDQPQDVVDAQGVWPPLLIFPEATNVNGRTVLQFKPGPFMPMMPVQPIIIDPRQQHLDVSWTGDCPVGMTLLRMMCQVYNRLHVTYLSPMAPIDLADTPKDFALRAQHEVARTLHVPTSQHSVLDLFMSRDVERVGMHVDAVNAETGAYPGTLDHARRRFHLFASFDKNKAAGGCRAVDQIHDRAPVRDGLLLVSSGEIEHMLTYDPCEDVFADNATTTTPHGRRLTAIAQAVLDKLYTARPTNTFADDELAAGRASDDAVDFRRFLILCELLYPVLDAIPMSPMAQYRVFDKHAAVAILARRRKELDNRTGDELSSAVAVDNPQQEATAAVNSELNPDGDSPLFDDAIGCLADALFRCLPVSGDERVVLKDDPECFAVPLAGLAGHTAEERTEFLSLLRDFALAHHSGSRRGDRRQSQSQQHGSGPLPVDLGMLVAFCGRYPVLCALFFATTAFGPRMSPGTMALVNNAVAVEDL